MIYILIYILVVLFSGHLFKRFAGTISVRKLNMMSWIFYYQFLLFTSIGALLIVLKVDNHYLLNRINDDSVRQMGFFAIMYSMIAFPIGMGIANRIWGVRNIKSLFNSYTSNNVQYEYKYQDQNVRNLVLFISVVCLFSVIYVLYILKEIPLLNIITGKNDILAVAEQRISVTREFRGNKYIRNILALSFTPLLSLIAYGYYRRDRTSFNRLWFIVMFISSIVILTYNYAKSPVLFYLLAFIFFHIYYKGSISRKALLYTVTGVFVLLIGLYISIAGSDLDMSYLFSYNSGILGRILLSQNAGTFLSFEAFPDYVDHIGFASISAFFSDFFGLEYSERSARILMEIYNPSAFEGGTAGVINSLFIAEAWANFGLPGVIIAPIYVGFFLQSLYLFLLKRRKTPVHIGLFAYLSTDISITGGFNDFIYNVNIFMLLILTYFFIYLFAKQNSQAIGKYRVKSYF